MKKGYTTCRTLFQPSTLKRHQPRLISTSGFREATPHVEHGQCQWKKEAVHKIKVSNLCRMSTCLQAVPSEYSQTPPKATYFRFWLPPHVDILQKFEAFIVWHSFFSHWHWPCSTCGIASEKPEAEISHCWWRLRVLGWNNVAVCWHLVRSWSL